MKALILPFIICSAYAATNEPLQTIVDDAWLGAEGYHFSGRLTEAHKPAAKDSGRLKTLYRTTRLLLTSGEEGMITWRVGELEWSSRVDDHGYWELASTQPLVLASGWHAITTQPRASSEAHLFVADVRNEFGIISDIDDTIMVSEVVHKRQLAKNSLTLPPENRQAVPGMSALFQKLLKQNAAPEASLIVYVSASPKQLTDSLRLFLKNNEFPHGLLQLKEIPSVYGDSLHDQRAYKLRRIRSIFLSYPKVRFSLFGDDGESDPEIYEEVRNEFPLQVAGIWIRRVHPNAERAKISGQRDLAELLVK